MEDKYRAALDAAAKQLSYRPLSARALQDRLLEKGHDEQSAGYALAWLAERGLLDDEAYAESVVRTYARRGCGARRIYQELLRRGVDRGTAETALEGFAPDADRLRALLDKRLHGDVSDRREIDRTVAFLQRRGYSWEEIRAALTGYGRLPDE